MGLQTLQRHPWPLRIFVPDFRLSSPWTTPPLRNGVSYPNDVLNMNRSSPSLRTSWGNPVGAASFRVRGRRSIVPALGSGRFAVALLLMLSVCVACDGDRSTTIGHPSLTWVTEADYRFGDSPPGEVFFGTPSVRADPTRGRIFAVDRPYHQVSAWTPDGALLFHVGREGEGPGEFIDIGFLHIEADGAFAILDTRQGRSTSYTASGELVGTTQGPLGVSHQGLSVELNWAFKGSYLGTPIIPSILESGWEGLAGEPVTRKPVVRVRDLGDGRWSNPEPVLWLDISNRVHIITLPNGRQVITSQWFGDPDHVRFEPGAAVVMRSKSSPGTVELTEVDVSGDTVWHRRLELPPRRLTSAIMAEAAERFVAQRASGGAPATQLRQAYYDGLYQPEYVPPAEGPPVLTASREVWIRTSELQDTLRVYYAVPRGDPTGSPRRVLLPESLWVTDATETHVWGVQWDSLDRPHVVGRRLVASPG